MLYQKYMMLYTELTTRPTDHTSWGECKLCRYSPEALLAYFGSETDDMVRHWINHHPAEWETLLKNKSLN